MARILIADDSPMVLNGLRNLIEHNNEEWQVCGQATNGGDAINMVRELHPDLLVLDLVMPGMNGFEVAREVSKALPHISILLCTMKFSSQVTVEARKTGIQGAVSKADVGDILSGIAALLRHETFYPPCEN